ncbi:MAG: acetyltransferase [Syntrophales bacterium]|nr:acetyltransferase [Syntrophales bacterium]
MREEIIVVGGGGHAKVVIATALECGINVSIIVDDDPSKWGQNIFGIKIHGPILSVKEIRSPAIMAIGNNRTRENLVKELENLQWISIIHPRAYVHRTAKVGKGTIIFAGSVIQPDARIGDHCIINTGSTVDHDCSVGDFCHLAPGTHIAGGVTIGRGVFLGVGAKVVVGKKIGDWSIIGAGAVVLEDLPDRVMAAGVPAKIKESYRIDT